MADDWTAGRTSAAYPLLRVLTYAAPDDQQTAEAVAVEVSERVQGGLHRPQVGAPYWGHPPRALMPPGGSESPG